MDYDNHTLHLNQVLETMSTALSSAREALSSLDKQEQNLNVKDGISLLSLKHHTMLSYMRSLALVSSHRVLGHSLNNRTMPTQPFSTTTRTLRGNGAGDLVDSMIEGRVVLEKIGALESRMRYQIEKLLKIAEDSGKKDNMFDDPLDFRPNPQNLMSKQGGQEDADSHPESFSRNDYTPAGDGIYRPPRLAPVPYVAKSKSEKRRDRPPVPSALATLSADPSRPHLETTSGLGGIPALASGRASYLKRLKDFEEENFSRLIMKKSDAKRRARDEEDLALGGNLAGGGGRRRAGGLADEFGDVLRSVDRVSGRGQGDGYEELRRKGKKEDVLSRSRRSGGLKRHEEADGGDDEPRPRKRSRFELDAKIAKKKLGKRRG